MKLKYLSLCKREVFFCADKKMASATGLEPATYGLGNRRSILVSYADSLPQL